MTLIFALCFGWLPGTDTCVAPAVLVVETGAWSEKPCKQLIPPGLRPHLVECSKTRKVAA